MSFSMCFRCSLFCLCRPSSKHNMAHNGYKNCDSEHNIFHESDTTDSSSDDERSKSVTWWKNTVQTQPMELFKTQTTYNNQSRRSQSRYKHQTEYHDNLDQSLICPVYPTTVVRQQEVGSATNGLVHNLSGHFNESASASATHRTVNVRHDKTDIDVDSPPSAAVAPSTGYKCYMPQVKHTIHHYKMEIIN